MNSQRTFVFIGALTVVALCKSDASAQPNMDMFRLMSLGAGQLHCELLAMEEVQKELELSEEQLEKMSEGIEEVNDAWRSERREIMMDGGEGAEAEINELLKELQQEEKEIVAHLNNDQQKRLQQLMYQRMGNAMLRHPAVRDALEITDEQMKDINAAFEQNEEAQAKALQEAQEERDFEAMRQIMTDSANQLAEELMNVLDEDQKEKIQEMKGQAFEFPQRRPRGRRGGRDF